jgi:hypothetical protein
MVEAAPCLADEVLDGPTADITGGIVHATLQGSCANRIVPLAAQAGG